MKLAHLYGPTRLGIPALALCLVALGPRAARAQAPSPQPSEAPSSHVEASAAVPEPPAAAPGAAAEDEPALDAGVTHEEDGPRLEWSDEWRPIGWPSVASSAALLGGVILTTTLQPPAENRWKRTNFLDDRAHRRLRLGPLGQDRAGMASDITLSFTAGMPLVDILGVALIADRNPEVAGRLTLLYAQSMAATGLSVQLAKRFAGRARPHEQDCLADPASCAAEEDVSFFSGHSAMAFTGAGLTCVTHRYMDLYGNEAADGAACGVAMVAASLTAIFRMMADEHWATDVMVGAGVGLVSGWLMPRLLYFDPPRRWVERRARRNGGTAPAPAAQTLAPWGDRNGGGLVYSRSL